MGIGGISIWQVLILLLIFLTTVVPFWQIYKKAGFNPWLSVLMIFPLLNVIMLFYLAFSSWPTSKQEA